MFNNYSHFFSEYLSEMKLKEIENNLGKKKETVVKK